MKLKLFPIGIGSVRWCHVSKRLTLDHIYIHCLSNHLWYMSLILLPWFVVRDIQLYNNWIKYITRYSLLFADSSFCKIQIKQVMTKWMEFCKCITYLVCLIYFCQYFSTSISIAWVPKLMFTSLKTIPLRITIFWTTNPNQLISDCGD